VLKGKVTSLAAYGAFVDIGGIEGLLHVSEIGHSRLAHPNEVLSEAQEVEVQITKIEPGKDGRERISLSMKSLAADPWQEAAARFTEGQEIDGIVKRLETFGAFVEIAPGIEGLMHISELAKVARAAQAAKSGNKNPRAGGGDMRLKHAREGAQLGQALKVKVLGVDVPKRRISLGAAVEDDHAIYQEFKKDRPQAAPTQRRGPGGPGGDRDRPRGGERAKEAAANREAMQNVKPQEGFGALADFFKKSGL